MEQEPGDQQDDSYLRVSAIGLKDQSPPEGERARQGPCCNLIVWSGPFLDTDDDLDTVILKRSLSQKTDVCPPVT